MTMESLGYSVGLQLAFATKGDIRRIINKTGLTGSYRVKMQFDLNATRGGVDATLDAGPSFFTALEEQLGLKMEPAKIMQETVVIDHIERPTPD